MPPQSGDGTKALKGRNVIAQGKAPARESALLGAPPCVAATNSLKPCKGDTLDNAAAIAALDSRLRGNDGIVNGGLAFGDYVRREQMRLLFALDNALSQKAEDALLNEFAAVKKAQVQLQSKLGGRKGNVGINLIGALDESDSRAIGWQFRAYAGQQESKGINAGLFYRTISNGMLHGVNAFADYEDGDDGAFFRYGIGGEVRHSLVAFSANYYLPVTDERKVNSTVAAFSRKGYDAKLRLNAPEIERLRVAVDYYHFGGKGNTAKDSGFRYGVEVDILPALRLGVYHDTESEKFGGDIAYSHTFNSPSFPQNSSSFLRRQESITDFAPDLFAPVSREYSQRIALVTTDAPPVFNRFHFAALTAGVPATIGTVLLANGGIIGGDSAFVFSAAMAGVFANPLTITSSRQTTTLTVNITAQNAPPIGAGFVGGAQGGFYFITSNAHPLTFGGLTVGGGYLAPGNNGYRFALSADAGSGTFALAGSAPASRQIQYFANAPEVRTATVIVDDDNEHTAPAAFHFTATAVATIMAGIAAGGHYGTMFAAFGAQVLQASITAGGGHLPPGGDYSFTFSQQPPIPSGAVINRYRFFQGSRRLLVIADNAITLTARIIVDDAASEIPPATLHFTVTTTSP